MGDNNQSSPFQCSSPRHLQSLKLTTCEHISPSCTATTLPYSLCSSCLKRTPQVGHILEKTAQLWNRFSHFLENRSHQNLQEKKFQLNCSLSFLVSSIADAHICFLLHSSFSRTVSGVKGKSRVLLHHPVTRTSHHMIMWEVWYTLSKELK